jgi:hypothetical protein
MQKFKNTWNKVKKRNLSKSTSISLITAFSLLFFFVGLREIARDQISYWGVGSPTNIGILPEGVSPIQYSFRLDEYTTGTIRFGYGSPSSVLLEATYYEEI